MFNHNFKRITATLLLTGVAASVMAFANLSPNVKAKTARVQSPVVRVVQNRRKQFRPRITTSNVHRSTAYDISQWQGRLNNRQVRKLKNEVNFMILRTQNGDWKDKQIDNNERLMNNNRIKYGVYSYSAYSSPQHAMAEARELHQRSPYANFYVNDCENNNAGRTLNASTITWANEMRKLTNKPIVLCSSLSFMSHHLSRAARNKYDMLWIVNYKYQPNPNYHYDLWQNSSHYHSPALGQAVDQDSFPYGAKPLKYWLGYNVQSKHYANGQPKSYRAKHTQQPRPKVQRDVKTILQLAKKDPHAFYKASHYLGSSIK